MTLEDEKNKLYCQKIKKLDEKFDKYHRESIRKFLNPPWYIRLWKYIKMIYPRLWWKFKLKKAVEIQQVNGNRYIVLERNNKKTFLSTTFLRTKEGRKWIRRFINANV